MTKFTYMKLVGLTMIIIGFSYCLTSFSNFYAYLYGDIIIANANVYLMTIGLVFPLYLFIFGVFFYFYTDKQFSEINPFIMISGIGMTIVGIMRLIFSSGLMQFIHFSFSFVSLLFGLSLIYGCIRYKY